MSSRIAAPAAAIALVAMACGAVACTPAVAPRSGRVLEPGGFAVEFRATPAAGAPATVELEKLTGHSVEVDGNSAARFVVPTLAWFGPWMWLEYGFRFGLFEPCELGLDYGMMQLGAEARCGLLDDRDGDPVSLAVGAAALYQAAHLESGWLGRLSTDLGLPLGRSGWSLIAGFAVQYGAHGHAMTLDEGDVDEKFLEDSDDFLFAGPPPWAYLERRELRLTGHLGATLDFEDGAGGLTLAVVPWGSAWVDSEPLASRCFGCDFLTPRALTERWGVALSTSLTLSTEAPTRDELDTRPTAPPGYHYERTLNDDLFGAGIGLLGASYAIGLGPAIMLPLANGDEDLTPVALWFIPLVGPVLWRQEIDTADPVEHAAADVFGYGTTLLQTAGLLLILQSWLYGDLDLVADDESGATVTLAPVALPGGLGLGGRF